MVLPMTTTSIDTSGFNHLYPFRSNYFDNDGLLYHYIDQGNGNPIVMLHGNPTWSFYYRTLISGLSPRYRTIVPDHIGCGLSDKPSSERYAYRLQNRVDDLTRFMDHLALNQGITLIAHDWGGMIAMAFATAFPQRIARIILMNTAAFFPPKNKRLPLRLRVVRNWTALAKLGVQGFNLFSLAARFMASRKGLSADVKRGLAAPYNSWKNRIATLKFVQDIPLEEQHPSFPLVKHVDETLERLAHLPMLILWGKHDFVFDGDYLDEWRRRFPDAEVHLFENAGHYVLEDEPSRLLTRINLFLTKYPLKTDAST